MSFITRFALDISRITIVFLIAVVVLGLSQFVTFPRQEDPPIVIREIVVSAYFPGMEPSQIEELITRQLEAQIRTLPEIDEIWSDSKTGVSIIHADVRDEYDDLDLIWQKVRNKMQDLTPDLPDGTIGPFVNDEFGLTAIATIALWSEGFSMAEMRIAARDIRDRLYELDGIRKVELWGVQDEQVTLKFSTTKLAQFGIKPGDVVNALIQQNVILPGGRIEAKGPDIIVEPSGNFRSVGEIENVLIQIPGTQQSTRLSDLLTVVRGYVDPPSALAYFNGRPAIVLSVSITPGVNSVEFGERLTAKIRDLESRLPVGYVLEYATFQPDLVVAAVNGALSNVYQTLVIVLAVVMLFLGLRVGLIVGSFVPMTMLLGLIIMGLMGIELERVSIASAIIALGMLVDNGIVVAEDIKARLERGQNKREACIESGRTLAVPLLTSSLTTILAFLPILLIEGQTGEYAFSLPAVVIILLLASWFLSMYATPANCFWFMKVPAVAGSAGGSAGGQDEAALYAGRFYRVYRRVLELMLNNRTAVLIGAVLVLVGGAVIASLLVRQFFGPSDRNQFLVYLDLPAGYSISATDEVVQRFTDWLADEEENPEITSSIAYIGTGGPRFFLSLAPLDPDPHLAFLIVNTETGEQTPAVVERLRDKLDREYPEVLGRVKQMWLGAQEPGFMEYRLVGPDPDVLYAKGEELKRKIKAIPGSLDVRNDWENKVPKILVSVDQARARRAGLTSQEVALSLQAHIDGAQITEYREGDIAIPVVIQSLDEERESLGDLWNVNVYSGERASNVPLTQIADISGIWQFSRLARRNQELMVTIEAKHQFLKAPEQLALVEPLIEELNLGPDYRWELGGELDSSAETNEKLFANMPICLAGIVVLLIWQFNSFRRPAIIILTIPLAFAGAFVGLIVMNAPFDFFSILGLFSLAGVIINNGIVLIDRMDSERAAGRTDYEAVVMASLARFRPIMMSTITTVLGVMPLIISFDPLFYSLACILAFGLSLGTMLTLGVVPVLYATFFGIRRAAG
ncbi:efflux RND transporter permease subunit [Pelagibius sp.]|uniref:efflux RND transporter permease subunit n=1 Tax=Pelagibius sp. TaxID=1931238 RepID=UPI0026103594|nr:efflux RND transporter permease subunit [Pelagibius sp.]